MCCPRPYHPPDPRIPGCEVEGLCPTVQASAEGELFSRLKGDPCVLPL